MTPTPQASSRHVAILADAENVSSPKPLAEILHIARQVGRPTIRRVYGDWTSPQLAPWKAVLHEFAFEPKQQFRYVKGGNSTDCALIVDAMDVLHAGKVDAVCLVASDSDYTRLVTRLQESGMFVLGVGAPHTPSPLRQACDRFVAMESLAPPPSCGHAGGAAKARGSVPKEGPSAEGRAAKVG